MSTPTHYTRDQREALQSWSVFHSVFAFIEEYGKEESDFIEWLIADCVRCNSRAVCVKLPERASVTKARSCLLSRGSLMNELGSSPPSMKPSASRTP